ncbi:MAG: capsular biosynthesis protein [Candidatus Hydrogenedentes bacterium]|nr:capsular biosynthesis protein [Candidatus Hydrogenedentota bacterium]
MTTPIKICCACSHGGHLNELLQIQEAFTGHEVFFFCYEAETTRRLERAYLVPNMARNPIEFLKNLGRVWRIFRREEPKLIVSTGAEIAIPVVLVGKLLRIPALYVECGAQVVRPSVTGRVMYWLADEFYVQWPELLQAYGPRARYAGSLIDETPAP